MVRNGNVAFGAALLAAYLSVAPAWAQEDEVQHIEAPEGVFLPVITSNCTGGVVYDDGVFNDAYSIGDGDPGDATMVMKFNLPAGTTALDQVCAAFTRTSGAPSSMAFEVVVYNDNGAGGQPGSFLGSQAATANGIPLFSSFQFYNVNMTSSGIVLPDTSIYVGVRWPGGAPVPGGGIIFLLGDRSSATPQRTNFGSGNSGGTWTNLNTLFAPTPTTGPPRALGVRVDVSSGNCVPSATAMCLNNNRFRVEAEFDTGTTSGDAQVVKLTDDSGYLWFFNAANIELVVKVLNACGVNNRYWVFAAGLTDVEVTIRVTDTKTGSIRTYFNPLNRAFPPVQDTSAFATCP